MPEERRSHYAFNRGIMSALAAARADLQRYALSAEVMTNWIPRVLGSMMLRPGWQYTGATRGNALSKSIPFIFSDTDTARIELTDSFMRLWVGDTLISRPTVTTTITNGDFTSDLSGWTDADEAGATSVWTAGRMYLNGTGANAAIRTQQVTVSGGNIGVEHGLRIVIARGPVSLRIGSSAGDDDIINETVLGTGTHSLAITPSGDFHIQLLNRRVPVSMVESFTIEAAGTMELPTSWAAADLQYIRTDQSADVVYVACKTTHQQAKIERRGTRSWSVVTYEPEDGPFRSLNTSQTTITPNATSGDISLTASKPIFRSTHVGALFRLTSAGQQVTSNVAAANVFSNPIRVTGVDDGRVFGISIGGVFTATITLQRSVGAIGSWVDVKTWTAAASESFDDTFDNQIIYYRIGIKAGNYTSGTANLSLIYAGGSITGIARATSYVSSTVLNAQVLRDLGGTDATADWYEGRWSGFRGWPSAVALHEGRLAWAGKDKIDLSVSDGYESFDDEEDGDAGPISRSIGAGPIDTVNWLMSLGRLMLGTAINSKNVAAVRADGNSVLMARSSSLDEPLTPSNFNFKRTLGHAFFVDRSGQRLYELAYDPQIIDYNTTDMSLTAPDLNEAGISHIAVQMKPDVRIHCVRTDGTVGMLIFDRAENVTCWVELETDGYVEDVLCLPGADEDSVYYTVRRTVNAAAVRYHEKWALESQCSGAPEARHADSFIYRTGAETTQITGLGHLEGRQVIAWGWNTAHPFTVTLPDGTSRTVGKDLGTFTVSGGKITGLATAVTDAIVGLAYEAQFKTLKFAQQTDAGSSLNARGRIEQIGLILRNAHHLGLRYGPTFDEMDDLPMVVEGRTTDVGTVWADYDQPLESFPGNWESDTRVCLQAAAPRPCTVLAMTVQRQTTR